MAAQTFRQVWGKVLLHAPTVPAALAQSWVQDAYDKLIANRHWAWTRRTTNLVTRAPRTVSASFTAGSTTITSAAQFIPEDAGRQLRINNGFTYTINQVSDPSTAVLLEAYADTAQAGTQTAQILDAYLAMPADFRTFETVDDQVNMRPIVWWIAKDRLDVFDPGRIAADSRFRVLAAHQISQALPTLGRLLYEAWPRPTAAGVYTMSYFVRTDTLQNDVAFQGVLATYTKALETYALSEAAKWPGTVDQKNPYFNLPLSKLLSDEFEQTFQELNVMDDDQYLMDLQQIDLASFGLAAVSASTSLLQRTDADVGAYFGGFR